VVVVALGLVLALAKPSQPHLQVRCYFQDVQGLRAGAKVRLAGVEWDQSRAFACVRSGATNRRK
jgi:hypothetical protein